MSADLFLFLHLLHEVHTTSFLSLHISYSIHSQAFIKHLLHMRKSGTADTKPRTKQSWLSRSLFSPEWIQHVPSIRKMRGRGNTPEKPLYLDLFFMSQGISLELERT